MILIITHKTDYTSDFIINKLNSRKIPYVRFNTEDCISNKIILNFGSGASHELLKKDKFKSIWYRRVKLPEISELRAEENFYLLQETDSYLNNLFSCFKSKWLSPPTAIRLAENKFLQLEIAEEIGFKIPKTLITTDRIALTNFLESNTKTIIKPISSGRIDYGEKNSKLIFTNIIPAPIINSLDKFDLVPAIYQEYVEKEYELRITVVDKEVFAAKVDSQSNEQTLTDWRRKAIKFEKYDLPEKLSNQCIEMLKRLNISFGAFDFIKTKEGEYYFLEVNPNGQWVWIELDTGLPISEAIIKFLS